MRYFFSLEISASIDQADKISTILGVEPNDSHVTWGHKMIIKDNGYANFIDYFLMILEGKYDELMNIGITKNEITIWMIYEYEEQCNLEFSPCDMKKIGDNGISLCISCYEVGHK